MFIITSKNVEWLIKKLNIKKIPFKTIELQNTYDAAIISCTFETLKNFILNEDEVYFIDRYQQPTNEIELVGYDRSLNGINHSNHAFANANGKNITIGIKENLLNIRTYWPWIKKLNCIY